MPELPGLHDVSLENICLEWDFGIVRLILKTGTSDTDLTVIEAVGVTDMKLPRLLPWGPSSSINSAKMEPFEGGQLLLIEMQSGDVLEIKCRELTTKP